MDQLLAAVLLIAITLTAISVVFSTGLPVIETSKSFASIDQAVLAAKFVDNAVREVASETEKSTRLIALRSPGAFTVLTAENSIEFSQPLDVGEDYLTRTFDGNMEVINGNDVSCSSGGSSMALENSYVRANFTLYASGSSVQTDSFLLSLEDKTASVIIIANSSIELDDDPSTRSGTGFSELLRSGSALPSCTARFFVNSTVVQYDVYYTLYAGADFLVADIANVVDK